MKRLQGKKIFFAISSDKSYTNQWQYVHFIDELERHSIGFEIFNINDYRQEEYQDILLKKITSLQKEVALFLTAYHDNQIFPSTVNAIKQLGIPTLLLCYDNLSMPHVHKHICSHFDLVWLTSYETEYLFKRWGANTIFLPYAANPYKFCPSFTQEILSVGFIGSLYGARGAKIKTLGKNKIPTRVYTAQPVINDNFNGNLLNTRARSLNSFKNTLFDKYYLAAFQEGRTLLQGDLIKAMQNRFKRKNDSDEAIHFYDSVSLEEMNNLYSSFALTLGITEVWNTYLLKKPLFKLHLRTFEIPMCGGLQITHRSPELETYFEDEKEIVLFGSDDEMTDKMRYYLSNNRSALRLQMKKAARERSEKDHCWMNRFNKIYQRLFA
jgi:spore maturation protein CgeB